jgi:pyruvyl transferase EpsO
MADRLHAAANTSQPLAAPGHQALMAGLAATIESLLAPLIQADRPLALLDFPQVPNVGDSMIWLGTIAFLAARGLRPSYTCSFSTYSRPTLERRLGQGTILLSGGGNFGDLYPPHQKLREAVIRDFPNHRIVQLPQTIRFETHEALEHARRVINRHRDLTLLVRDAPSLALAEGYFSAPARLCPDMAFALGPLPRPVAPSHPVVWLARTDKEAKATLGCPVPEGVLRTDWPRDGHTAFYWANRRLSRLLRRMPAARGLLEGPLGATYAPLARQRVRRGSRLLSAGRVVITNRLHGHILSLLLGIPHAVLDNSYGKVRGVYEAWTRSSPLVHWSTSDADALAHARALATSSDRASL